MDEVVENLDRIAAILELPQVKAEAQAVRNTLAGRRQGELLVQGDHRRLLEDRRERLLERTIYLQRFLWPEAFNGPR